LFRPLPNGGELTQTQAKNGADGVEERISPMIYSMAAAGKRGVAAVRRTHLVYLMALSSWRTNGGVAVDGENKHQRTNSRNICRRRVKPTASSSAAKAK